MKIAIVGSGISGLVCAYLLSEDHDVTVFEARDHVGGHTNTRSVTVEGKTYGVDTGFIVFNERNYPYFVRFLRRLGVPWQRSDMSVSVRNETSGLEYCPSSLNRLFAQRRNILRPSFHRMLREILRFRRESGEVLAPDAGEKTLGAYLAERGYSEAFARDFIVPLGAAIWSAPPARLEEFPARLFVEFFTHHQFLNFREQPQWLTVAGGSRRYVDEVVRRLGDRIRTRCPVTSVSRHADGVTLKLDGKETARFDEVVMAAHSDQALALLADADDREREILGALPYQENETVLHTDEGLLPRSRRAWASWNYVVPHGGLERVLVTYNMNRLQSLDAPATFCVSLNAGGRIRPETVLYRVEYHHPLHTVEGAQAQARRDEISGRRRTHFCGAYWGYGFHEDGAASALAVCRRFGKEL